MKWLFAAPITLALLIMLFVRVSPLVLSQSDDAQATQFEQETQKMEQQVNNDPVFSNQAMNVN